MMEAVRIPTVFTGDATASEVKITLQKFLTLLKRMEGSSFSIISIQGLASFQCAVSCHNDLASLHIKNVVDIRVT